MSTFQGLWGFCLLQRLSHFYKWVLEPISPCQSPPASFCSSW